MTTEPDPRWEAAASREPYFSILTASRFRSANLTAAHEREFFDSGEVFVESALRVIEARFVPQFTPASVLEYGCGVGRLAIPFARRAGSITAVDRSPTMLPTDVKLMASAPASSAATECPPRTYSGVRK